MKDMYEDMLDMPHHVSPTRPKMSIENRAAQFSPFAALTGYDAAISETARLTDQRVELDADAIAVLNEKLRLLNEIVAERPEIAVTYFLPDEKKEGGVYITATGPVKKVDDYERTIVFMSGEIIPIADVLDIEGEMFKDVP